MFRSRPFDDQAAPKKSTLETIRKASAAILANQDAGRWRPILFEAVEKDATSDLTDVLAPLTAEDASYRGLVSVFTDAVANASDKESEQWARYNLARFQYQRARRFRGAAARPYLDQASQTLASASGSPRERAFLELAGDIESERGNVNGAIAIYQRLTPVYGNAAPVQYRVGLALRRAGRLDEATKALEAGLKADRNGKLWRHMLYQALGWIAVDRGNLGDASNYLGLSAKVKQDEDAPFRLRLDLAQELLNRNGRGISAFARAALELAPDDEAAKQLLADAQAKGSR